MRDVGTGDRSRLEPALLAGERRESVPGHPIDRIEIAIVRDDIADIAALRCDEMDRVSRCEGPPSVSVPSIVSRDSRSHVENPKVEKREEPSPVSEHSAIGSRERPPTASPRVELAAAPSVSPATILRNSRAAPPLSPLVRCRTSEGVVVEAVRSRLHLRVTRLVSVRIRRLLPWWNRRQAVIEYALDALPDGSVGFDPVDRIDRLTPAGLD